MPLLKAAAGIILSSCFISLQVSHYSNDCIYIFIAEVDAA